MNQSEPPVRDPRNVRNLIGQLDSIVEHLHVFVGRPPEPKHETPIARENLMLLLGVLCGAVVAVGVMRLSFFACQ